MSLYSNVIKPREVDKIMDKKIVCGKARYLVKWKHRGENMTWEVKEDFLDSSIVERFESTLPKKIAPKRSSLNKCVTNEGRHNKETQLPESNVEDSFAINTNNQECKTVVNEPKAKQITTIESITDLLMNEFQCSICHDIFKEACMTECGHCFCEQCINKWKKEQRCCPICRTPLNKSEKNMRPVNDFIVKASSLLIKDQ